MTRKTDRLGERPEAPGETCGDSNHPAINVSWYDAMAFCRWLGRRLALGDGEQIRLPTEWEWQWSPRRRRRPGIPVGPRNPAQRQCE